MPPLSPAQPGRPGGSCLWPHPGQVFSQHPYAENFIGKPHVWTVDYNNSEEFEAAIKAIMRSQVRVSQVGLPQPTLCVFAIIRKGCPSCEFRFTGLGGIDPHSPMWRTREGEVCLCSEQPVPPYMAALGPELLIESTPGTSQVVSECFQDECMEVL